MQRPIPGCGRRGGPFHANGARESRCKVSVTGLRDVEHATVEQLGVGDTSRLAGCGRPSLLLCQHVDKGGVGKRKTLDDVRTRRLSLRIGEKRGLRRDAPALGERAVQGGEAGPCPRVKDVAMPVTTDQGLAPVTPIRVSMFGFGALVPLFGATHAVSSPEKVSTPGGGGVKITFSPILSA